MEAEPDRHAEEAVVEPVFRLVVVRVDPEEAVRVSRFDNCTPELHADPADESEVERLDLAADAARVASAAAIKRRAIMNPQRLASPVGQWWGRWRWPSAMQGLRSQVLLSFRVKSTAAVLGSKPL